MSAFLYPVFGRLTDISVLPVGLWVRGNPTDVREKPDTGISEKLTISVSGSFILEKDMNNFGWLYYVSCACMYPEKEAISLEEAPQDLDIWYKEGDTPSGGQ